MAASVTEQLHMCSAATGALQHGAQSQMWAVFSIALNSDSVAVFKSKLKIFLFSQAFSYSSAH